MNLTFDDGYQFGLGAFETVSLVKGQPVWLEAHEQRLRRALHWLGIALPLDWKDQFRAYIEGEGAGMGVVKILASDNNLSFTSRKNPYEDMPSRPGFVLSLSDIRRNESSPFVFHKTFNYGDSIVAKRKAAQLGIDEPIFCNTKGEIDRRRREQPILHKKWAALYAAHRGRTLAGHCPRLRLSSL